MPSDCFLAVYNTRDLKHSHHTVENSLLLILWWWRAECHVDISLPLSPGGLRHHELKFHGLADLNSGQIVAVVSPGLQDDINLT